MKSSVARSLWDLTVMSHSDLGIRQKHHSLHLERNLKVREHAVRISHLQFLHSKGNRHTCPRRFPCARRMGLSLTFLVVRLVFSRKTFALPDCPPPPSVLLFPRPA